MTQVVHERYVSPDAPSVRDIERIRAQLLLFAKRHNMLSRHDKRDTRDALRYMVKPMVQYERPDIINILNTNGQTFGLLYKRTLGALAAYDVDGEQRLRIVQGTYASELGDSRGGVKCSYLFNWKGDHVTQARREVEITPSRGKADMYDLIDHFSISDDEASILTARAEVEQLTTQDVSLLNDDIRQLADSIDHGERAYSEDKKKQYMDYFAS
jgi:hypothetical protein